MLKINNKTVSVQLRNLNKYENKEDKEEETVPSDITGVFSPDISISLNLQMKEIDKAELQDESKGFDNDKAMKLYPTEFVG